MNDEEIVAATRARQLESKRIFAPASSVEIAAAEKRLGFPFVTLLRRLLEDVGNGVLLPEGSLLGIPSAGEANRDIDGRTMLDLRGAMAADGMDGVVLRHAVPLCDLGCAQWLWLDCDMGADGTVLTMADEAIYRTDLTLRTWWMAALENRMLEVLFEEGSSRIGIDHVRSVRSVR